MTLSCLSSKGLQTDTKIMPTNLSAETNLFGLFEHYLTWIDPGETKYRYKLELGPVQTLAHKDENGNWILNDPPPNKALELTKCQRYFVSFGQYTILYKSAQGDLTLDTPVPMRTFPAIVKQASNFTFTVAWINKTQLLLRVPEGETAPTGDAMLASSLWLSAEL